MVALVTARDAGLATSRWLHNGRSRMAEWYKDLYKDFSLAVQEAVQESVHAGDDVTVVSKKAGLAALDEQYQRVMVERFDRLFGRPRGDQLAHVSPGELLVGEDERSLNRHIGAAVVCMASTIGGIFVFTPLLVVALGAAAYSCVRIFKNGYNSIVHERKLRMDVMGSLYFIGAFAGGYFIAGAFGLLAFYMSEKLVLITQDRSYRGLLDILGQRPGTVWKLVDGVEVDVPIEAVQAGDTVVIQAGQVFPIDGVIIRGFATIDEHMLTGESQPVAKAEGDHVLTSTSMMAGKVQVKVEKAGNETVVAQIAAMLNETASYQASIVSRAEQLADRSVPPTMVLALIALPLSGYRYAVTVLGSAIGLNVKLTAPIAMVNFLNVAADHGVLVKDGRSLELLKDVDTIVFDKAALESPTTPPSVIRDVVRELRTRDIRIVVISSDAETPTRELAESLDIPKFYADTSPEEKATLVAQLQSEGRSVCFVGDGINDAISLNRANVSVSLGGAGTAAIDSAQIVLMSRGLEQLPFIFQLSDEFDSNMRAGYAVAVGQGVIVIAGAMLRVISIIPGTIIWVGSLAVGLGIAQLPLRRHRMRFDITPTNARLRQADLEMHPGVAVDDVPPPRCRRPTTLTHRPAPAGDCPRRPTLTHRPCRHRPTLTHRPCRHRPTWMRRPCRCPPMCTRPLTPVHRARRRSPTDSGATA